MLEKELRLSQLITLVAYVQLLISIAVLAPILLIIPDRGDLVPDIIRLLICVAYGGAAVFLNLAIRERFSIHLAAAFLLSAVSYSNAFVDAAKSLVNPFLLDVLELISALSIEAFIAFETWLFFLTYFDSLSGWRKRAVLSLKNLSLVAAIFLVIVNAAPSIAVELGLDNFLSSAQSNFYQTLIYLPMLPFLPAITLMYFIAPDSELRKVGVLILGFGLSLPAILIILASALVPGVQNFVTQPLPSAFFIIFLNILLLLVPVVVTYALIVFGHESYEGALSNKVLYRMALVLVYAILVIPFTGLVWYLYSMRSLTLAEIVADQRFVLLFTCAAIFIGVWVNRTRLGKHLAKLFYRSPYDLESVYSKLINSANGSANIPALLNNLSQLLQLHLQPIKAIPVINDPFLKQLVGNTQTPSEFSLATETYTALTSSIDTYYMSNTANEPRVSILFRNKAHEVVAAILLDEKRSGENYDVADKEFFARFQETVQPLFHHLLNINECRHHDFLMPFEAARECLKCQSLYSPQQKLCASCNSELDLASAPFRLKDKYHLIGRIGIGAFGHVYLGTDQTLARKVAVKCLPKTASDSDRDFLKREALMMAAISHPNLAVVYGVEFWHDRPLLIVEYLPGGTLKDLDTTQINSHMALQVIRGLCEVIDHTHSKGVLHLDIKPSNIGLSQSHEVKLLDFGTAHFLKSIPRLANHPLNGNMSVADAFKTSVNKDIVGTPMYMSPEAHKGHLPDVRFDLWSVSVVIVELLTHRHPFQHPTWGESQLSILQGQPNLPPWVSECFRDLVVNTLLAPDYSDRPESAREIASLVDSAWSTQ